MAWSRAASRNYGLMETSVVHIHITGMVHVHHLRLMPLYPLLNALDQIEAIERIKPVIRKIKELDTCYTENGSSRLCSLGQGGKLIASPKAITLFLP